MKRADLKSGSIYEIEYYIQLSVNGIPSKSQFGIYVGMSSKNHPVFLTQDGFLAVDSTSHIITEIKCE